MKTSMIFCLILFSTHVIAQEKSAESKKAFTSPYAGEEGRSIKSLSLDDIEELSTGKGWGFAKVAELNGIPGPKHVLEMETQINLTTKQKDDVAKIFQKMQSQAISLGEEFIKHEADLNKSFLTREIDQASLRMKLMEIAKIRASLRLVHLVSHLETVKILTDQQVKVYNELRGYASGDVCKEVPEGHDAELWKKHNNCN